MKNKKLISLILAAVMALSGCSQSVDPAVIESVAQSVVASALAETSVPDTTTAPDETTAPETTTAPDETTVPETTTAPDETTAPETTTTKAAAATETSNKAETDKDTPPVKELSVEPDTTTATAAAATTKSETTTIAPESAPPESSVENAPSKSSKLKITNEYMYQVTNLKTMVSYESSKYAKAYPIFYNFNKKLSTGFDPTNIGYNVNKMIALETDRYGIIGEVTGDLKIKLRVYNNTDNSVKLKKSYIENACTSLDGKWFENKLKLNEDVILDLSTLPTVKEQTRFWVVRATLEVGKSAIEVWTFICTNVDETWLCAKTEQVYTYNKAKKLQTERKELIDQFIKDNINPKNELEVLGFMHYPRPDFDKPDKNKDETEEWVKLVKSIDVSGMSDDRKVWTAYEWINNNIAYDDWERLNCVGKNGGNIGRSVYFKDSTGKYDTYQIRCGVCWDMANLMAIFCRTWGIPTVVISDKSHAWCAVYLNGRWTEFDCTMSNKYIVKTQDTSIRTEDKYRRYDYLLTAGRIDPNETLKAINTSLACCPGWSDLSKSYTS